MWRKPGTEAPAPAAPPTPAGETLLELDRGKGKVMRVARETYENHPFISLRVWENGFPTKSGTSLRLRELPELIRVLGQFEEDGPEARPGGKTSRDVLPEPRGGLTPPWQDEAPSYVPPRNSRPEPRDMDKPMPSVRSSERPFNEFGEE